MKKILYPDKREWQQLTQRPAKPVEELEKLVDNIFTCVLKDGDHAVNKYTSMYDKVLINKIRVSKEEIKEGLKKVPDALKDAIKIAAKNIEKFHASQIEKIKIIETMNGVYCWRESRPIEKAGIYIPGGSTPLFSTVLMLSIPAKIAGCKEIFLCSPPGNDGNIHPSILYAASVVGITSIYKAGGIQAIAAMTYGTETIPKADKIFGPGNQYVTAAKKHAQKFVAIDMPAGPSEVLVIADKSAVPDYIAADLLAQAEHGEDSQVILLSTDKNIIKKTLVSIQFQLAELPRKEIAEKALKNSKVILLKSIKECIELSNIYAPEHLILAVKNSRKLSKKIINAGSVFLGNYSCESAGDYGTGTNHTLPTDGYARSYSGVSVDSFIKKITFQQLNKKGLSNIGPAIEIMAEAEILQAHKNAVTIRLKNIKS